MATTQLGGKAEVAINEILIPAKYLSEVSVELTEGTRERSTLGGTFTRPSGVLETAQATFTLWLPNMDYLKNIFPNLYGTPSGPQTAGNIIFNSDTCETPVTGPVNIHYTCEATDENDIHFYEAQAQLNFNVTYTNDSDLSVEVTIFAQPDDDGNVARIGTGDLDTISVYDPETEETIPYTS